MPYRLLTEDNGKTIEVSPGESFTIELPGNPTTGFRWVRDGFATTEMSDNKFSVNNAYERSNVPPRMMGSGGTEHFKVTPLTREVHKFVLVYKRPWVEETRPTDKKYTITVRPK